VRLGVEAALVGGRILPGDVEIEDDLIVGVGLANGAGQGVAAPGFVDLQVNGFAGIDLLGADLDGYTRVGDALLETGVTAYAPTFITSAEETLLAALEAMPTETEGPRILGAHVEGPFLSPDRMGTHPPKRRRDPDLELAARILGAGQVRMMTLAPELPGALGLVDYLVERGVTVSLGHTNATAEEAHAAFDRGARTVTHLFNAMRPLRQRDPGVVGAALAREDVVVQLIVDGVHLAPEVVKIVLGAARGRVALVTDATAGAGLSDGTYALGEVEVVVRNGSVRRPDGVLAGSALTMIEAVRNVHGLGATLDEALAAATEVPARVVGATDVGRLVVGASADLVVLNDRLEIDRVLVGGRIRVAA
jgi:N-acetylglucosamine-6-phosphate deacetylase